MRVYVWVKRLFFDDSVSKEIKLHNINSSETIMNPYPRAGLALVILLLWIIIYRNVRTKSSPEESQTVSEGQDEQLEEKSELPTQGNLISLENPTEENYYHNFLRVQLSNSEKSYQVCI